MGFAQHGSGSADQVEDAGRQSGFGGQLRKDERGQRRDLASLKNDCASSRDRGSRLDGDRAQGAFHAVSAPTTPTGSRRITALPTRSVQAMSRNVSAITASSSAPPAVCMTAADLKG